MVVYIAFVIIAIVNAVNLTDGLDGLASSVTCIVSLFIPVIGVLSSYNFFKMLGKSALSPGIELLSASVYDEILFFVVIAGACMGFLVFNRYPAKIFMGDTGSLALGGALAITAIFTKMEIVLAIVGFVYVAEALSDIIQVLYFKKTGGKRIFKMAPIHHHFELSGWSERKVVSRFATFTLILCLIMTVALYIQFLVQG
jgi:phospho-N-acetylmuramoyl-pentapeptide-transferase